MTLTRFAIRSFAAMAFGTLVAAGLLPFATAQTLAPDGVSGTFSIVAADPEAGVYGAAVASKYPAVGKVVPYVRAAGIRVAKTGVDGYWLELYVDKSDDAVNELVKKYLDQPHDARGQWRGELVK